MREFVVYSRRGCHLCDEMLEQLEPLCRDLATIEVRDIDSREEWSDAYGIYIPVLVMDDIEICHYELDKQKVIKLLESK